MNSFATNVLGASSARRRVVGGLATHWHPVILLDASVHVTQSWVFSPPGASASSRTVTRPVKVEQQARRESTSKVENNTLLYSTRSGRRQCDTICQMHHRSVTIHQLITATNHVWQHAGFCFILVARFTLPELPLVPMDMSLNDNRDRPPPTTVSSIVPEREPSCRNDLSPWEIPDAAVNYNKVGVSKRIRRMRFVAMVVSTHDGQDQRRLCG